jgi:hypothetical protein
VNGGAGVSTDKATENGELRRHSRRQNRTKTVLAPLSCIWNIATFDKKKCGAQGYTTYAGNLDIAQTVVSFAEETRQEL